MLCVGCHEHKLPGVSTTDTYYCLDCWYELDSELYACPELNICHACENKASINIDVCPFNDHKYCQDCICKCKYCNRFCCYLCIQEDNMYCGPFVKDNNCNICLSCYNICQCGRYLIAPSEEKCDECMDR
jgi:hypothetical protein